MGTAAKGKQKMDGWALLQGANTTWMGGHSSKRKKYTMDSVCGDAEDDDGDGDGDGEDDVDVDVDADGGGETPRDA